MIGDVPSATAILDRFLHHAEILTIAGKSYRLRNKAAAAKAVENESESSRPAIPPTGSMAKKRAKHAEPNAAETAITGEVTC